MSDREPRLFSLPWLVLSVFIFTMVELAMALVLAPAMAVGHAGSPMLDLRIGMLMHLASYFVGGFLVGVFSPGVRLLEPAVGAVVAVALVLLMAVFLPSPLVQFSLGKLVMGGGIAFVLALVGAYLGEVLMGNMGDANSKRSKFRRTLWDERGMLARGDARHLEAQLRALKRDAK
jgi:hypothetical protein